MNSRKNGSARIWLVAPVASAICVLAPLSSAQEAPSSSVAAVAATPEVIPLRAIVMDVAGKARWRASASGSWKGAEVNDLLDPGAEVQTGTDSRVTLRVGKNATVLVDQNTVFRIPEIVQDGETLRTVAAVQRGRVDMKVDHLGLQNDFKVSTPSTTLAVKGTDLAVSEGSLMGFEVFGARTNAMNAIELKYALSNLKYFLSGAAASSSRLQDPVQKAWLNTLGPPAIAGLLSSLAEQEQKASQGFTNSEGATNTGSSASRLSEAKTETRGTTGTALTEAQLDSYAARAVDAEQAAAGLRDVWVTGRRLAIDFRALAQQRGVLAKSAYDAHVAAVNAAQVAALEAGVQLGIANAEKNGAAADHVAANQQLDQVVADIEAHKYESAELGTDEANSLIDSAGAHADASAAAALAAMMQSAAASEASTASTNAIQKYFVALGLTIQAANGSNSASVITKAASDLCAQFAALSQHFADLSTRGGAFQAAANAHALANAAANSAVVALNARNQALQAAQLASTYAQMILFTAAAEAAQQALDHANAAADAAAIAAAEAELAAALRTEYAVLAAERALAQEINAANAAGLAVDFRNLALQKEVEAGLAKDAHNAAVADAQAAADAASAALQSAILARDETASHLGAAVAAASNAAASMAQGSDQALLVDAPAFVSESQQQANLADGSATAAEGFRDAAETAKNFAIDHSMSAEQAGNQFLAAVEAANKAAADASSQSDIAKTASDLAAAYAQLAWTLSQAAGTDEASMAAVNAATSAYNAGQHALAAMLARDMALSAADAATSLGE
ncbi:MAG: FecR domain-containing protein, partial [Phycisphaerae bacterium]|nr:FecR domain-containing protein [Phycisphaerae bacterium]